MTSVAVKAAPVLPRKLTDELKRAAGDFVKAKLALKNSDVAKGVKTSTDTLLKTVAQNGAKFLLPLLQDEADEATIAAAMAGFNAPLLEVAGKKFKRSIITVCSRVHAVVRHPDTRHIAEAWADGKYGERVGETKMTLAAGEKLIKTAKDPAQAAVDAVANIYKKRLEGVVPSEYFARVVAGIKGIVEKHIEKHPEDAKLFEKLDEAFETFKVPGWAKFEKEMNAYTGSLGL